MDYIYEELFVQQEHVLYASPPADFDSSLLPIVASSVLAWLYFFPYQSNASTSFTGPVFALTWVITWCFTAQSIFINLLAPNLSTKSRLAQLTVIIIFFTILLEVIRATCQIYDLIGFEFTKRIPTEKHYTAPIGDYQRTQFNVCHAITVCHFISVITMYSGMMTNDLEMFKLGLIANMAYEVYHSTRLAYEYFITKTAQKKVFVLTMLHHACGLSTTLSVCALDSLDPRFVSAIYELLLSGLTGVLTITVAPTFNTENPMHLYVLTSILAVRVGFFFQTRFGSVILNLYGLLNDGVFEGSMFYYVTFGTIAITLFNGLIGAFMTKKLIKLGKKYLKKNV